MRTIVLAMVVAAGIPLVIASPASAMPVDGAAIARIGQQVAPVINVATKKKKAPAASQANAPCPADQERSNRTGNCRPLKSER
jgi:hypothetical protein